MYESKSFAEDQPRPTVLGLVALTFALVVGAALLYVTAGPPKLPPELPGWDATRRTLVGSDVPIEAVGYLVTTIAWATWLWIVGSIFVRAAALAAEAKTQGSAWARRARGVSDRITLPIVRRIVDAALFAVVTLHIGPTSTPHAVAATLPTIVEVGEADWLTPALGDGLGLLAEVGSPETKIRYTVQEGDTLWTISERFFGTGFEYMRLVEANAGREMADGRWFTRAAVIHPGWVLEVPQPTRTVEELEGELIYTVAGGDTLSGIGTRLLGDEMRWPEIFELNKGVARTRDGQVLTNADLIWPGLRLRLPGAIAPAPALAPAQTPEDPGEVEPPAEPMAPFNEIAPTDEAVADASLLDESSEGAPPEAELPAPAPPAERRPTLVVETPRSLSPGPPEELIFGAAAAAVSAAVGGGIYLARRRFRRSLSEPPVSLAELGYHDEAGFAEEDVARAYVHHVHGTEVEPISGVVRVVVELIGEDGISDVGLVTAMQGRDSIRLILDAGVGDQERIAQLAPALGARLDCACEAHVNADHDIQLDMAGLRLATLVIPVATTDSDLPILLPVGLSPRRTTLYANWDEMGNVLVAGSPGSGSDSVLTGLIASLVALRPPREVQLWTLAERGTVAPQILELPHQRGVSTDPGAEQAASTILAELKGELDRRAREDEAHDMGLPELVLLIGDLADLEDGEAIDLILRDGPEHGIRVVAGATRPDLLSYDLTSGFTTRLVLHLDAESESIQLLGRPDAADLGADGDLLLRLGGRAPVGLRGFRVASENLDRLIDLMGEAYGSADPLGDAPASGSKVDESAGALEDAESSPLQAGLEAPSGIGRPPDEANASDHGPDLGARSLFDQHGPRVGEAEGERGGNEESATSVATVIRVAPEPTPSSFAAVARAGEPQSLLAILEQRRTESLVQVRCFGLLQVTSAQRELTPQGEDGPRHKAWEILACLAAHPRRGMPKDKLLGALWPGVGFDSASNRLGANLSFLRAVLAEQVPGLRPDAVRGDKSEGMYRLEPNVVWSDVHEFLALGGGARKLPPSEQKVAYERARSLYRGDLLTGAPYKWVKAEDEHGFMLWENYRERYRQLTCRLAQLYGGEGELARAVSLYRDLLHDEPTLEDVARHLFRSYQQLGDRNSLIRDERLLREAIRQRYSDPDDRNADPALYEPDEETIQVYREVLAALDARLPERAQGRVRSDRPLSSSQD